MRPGGAVGAGGSHDERRSTTTPVHPRAHPQPYGLSAEKCRGPRDAASPVGGDHGAMDRPPSPPSSGPGVTDRSRSAAVDLYWLPLGAGGRSVRLNGRVFEAVAARLQGRAPCDLYHSALEVHLAGGGRFIVEQAPVP